MIFNMIAGLAASAPVLSSLRYRATIATQSIWSIGNPQGKLKTLNNCACKSSGMNRGRSIDSRSVVYVLLGLRDGTYTPAKVVYFVWEFFVVED